MPKRNILSALSTWPMAVLLVLPACLAAQTEPGKIGKLLETPLTSPEITAFQLRRYLLEKAPKLARPVTAEQWTGEASALRRKILDQVIFHGWPRGLVEAPPRFEDLGPIPAGIGYRMRKLRYESALAGPTA